MQDVFYIICYGIACILFIVALIGTIYPLIPGPTLAFVLVLIFKLLFTSYPPSWLIVIIIGCLAAISFFTDYLMSVIGAKKFGATKYGAWGALLGGIIGMFISWIWVFVGPIIGAILFELLCGKNTLNASLKSGTGAFVGTVCAVIFKVAIVLFSFWIFVKSCQSVEF